MPGCRCAIYSCNNRSVVTKSSDTKIVYHSFPKGSDVVSRDNMLKEWINCCGRSDKFNPSSSVICSIHFTQNDYVRDLQNELLGLPLKKILKRTAVPTLNIPGKTKKVDAISGRQDKHTWKERISRVQSIVKRTSSKEEPTPPETPHCEPQPTPCTSDSSTHSLITIKKKYNDLLKNYNDLKTKHSGCERKIKILNARVKYYKTKCKSDLYTRKQAPKES